MLVLVAAWVASVGLAYRIGGAPASPDTGSLREQHATLQAEHERALQRIERLNQKVTTLQRSEQVERDASRTLQETLAERDGELASLRNDVAFFERLVGASAQRQPLAVHSLSFEPLGDGGWRYHLTLTQTLKKAAISKGNFTLQVEGSLDGSLQTLEWGDLLQNPEAPAQTFSFKYFQQIEGSIALPTNFLPHRVRVLLQSDQGRAEQVIPWSEPSSSGVS